jgi:two-component system phosphate regulon sensor histidine kinase PhoR
MHPLRVLMLVSLAIAIAVAWGLGSALHHAGVEPAASVVLAVLAFGAFMIPWSGTFFWAVRRARDLDLLTERSRQIANGELEIQLGDRAYHGELDDLARAVEEIRAGFVRQKRSWEEHRAAMEEIVSSLGEGLLAVSPERRIVVANRRVAEMFEAPLGALTGKNVLEVVRKQSVVAALDKALEGQASTDRVTYGSGGSERQFEIRTFPVEASPEIAAVAIFIDVTTIERLQRIRREFLDDFSHEARTPLAGLRSAADTLEHGGLTRDYEVQLRHVMQRQIARIERLVTDLSELNRIESGQIVLQRTSVELRELLKELADDFGHRNAGVRFEVSGEETRVFADAIRLQQIFSNLLDNACRHGGGEGTVRVEVGAEQARAVVRVCDEGPGIPPAELERVFNRFYRVDRSRSTPGTGLGLAIAKHLVVAHGGTIRAFNRPEGGATFEVRLPAELT